MTVFRSTLFLVWFVLATVVLNLGFLPALLLPRRASVIAGRTWAAATLWGLRIFAGLGFEVRGTLPRGAVLVASKHMSMWDTLALYMLLDAPIVVLKRELLNIPFYGWYAHRAGVISIDREGHASALRQMAADAKKALARRRITNPAWRPSTASSVHPAFPSRSIRVCSGPDPVDFSRRAERSSSNSCRRSRPG